MGEILRTKSQVVFKRNTFGRFAGECEMAANSTVRRLVETGARSSRSIAPSGKKGSYVRKPGYIPLKRSIRTQMVSRTSGYWYSTAPHAMFVEFGTSAHTISGKLTFWWAREGRWFVWNNPKYHQLNGVFHSQTQELLGAVVHHPGTRAHPFLRPAYESVKRIAMQVAREEYPG